MYDMYLFMCAMYMQVLEARRGHLVLSLELELQALVNCYVGAENQTQILCESD